MEKRELNKTFEEIGNYIIDSLPEFAEIRESNVRIAFLESDSRKMTNGQAVYGECEKVLPKNKWAMNYDFTITIYTKNTVGFTDEQLEILLEHELLHIGAGLDDSGRVRFFCKQHDLMEFKSIIEKYGVDWDKPREE